MAFEAYGLTDKSRILGQYLNFVLDTYFDYFFYFLMQKD